MPVSVLKQHDYLIAALQVALSDADWLQLRDDLLRHVGRFRSRGVIIDVGGLDVLDSFATRLLGTIAEVCKLRGAETVIVGIRPEIAFNMVQLGWTARLAGIGTALDLEDGLALLEQHLTQEGISVEVIDLRTLAPLDIETLVRSATKTRRVVIAHEAVECGGVGAEVAARLGTAAFDELDAPIVRVGCPFAPIPFAPELEQALLPGREHIVRAVRELAG